MAPKKELVKNRDQFIVRLPEGMRERIKAKADRAGMSMNEAIVWCLGQHFPEPRTMEAKIEDLADMVAILKGDDSYTAIDDMIDEIHVALEDVRTNKISAPPNFKKAVKTRLERYYEERGFDHDEENDFPHALYDDEPFAEVHPEKEDET